jgi:hypothetical protein
MKTGNRKPEIENRKLKIDQTPETTVKLPASGALDPEPRRC